jgi:hypothetical protein
MTKAEWVKRGAHGLAIPQGGLRPESFTYLRAGGKPVPTLPVTLAIYPGGKLAIVDGRHRITIARELGHTHVPGKIVAYGPRLGVLWRYTGAIRV